MSEEITKTQKYARDLLETKMSEFSEDSYAAGWLIDLEYDMWRLANAGGGGFGMMEMTAAFAAELLELARDAGGWQTCDDFVPMEQWIEIYRAWDEAYIKEYGHRKSS